MAIPIPKDWTTKAKTNHQGETSFVFAVAKYFMDFLETNFQKRRIPKRIIQTRNKKNLLVGLNTKKYFNFYLSLLQKLNSELGNAMSLTVSKGQHTVGLSGAIQSAVKNYSESIDGAKHETFLNNVADEIKTIIINNQNDAELAKTIALTRTQELCHAAFVQPLFEKIGSSLKSLYDFDESHVIELSFELNEAIIATIEETLNEIVSKTDISKERQARRSRLSVFYLNLPPPPTH